MFWKKKENKEIETLKKQIAIHADLIKSLNEYIKKHENSEFKYFDVNMMVAKIHKKELKKFIEKYPKMKNVKVYTGLGTFVEELSHLDAPKFANLYECYLNQSIGIVKIFNEFDKYLNKEQMLDLIEMADFRYTGLFLNIPSYIEYDSDLVNDHFIKYNDFHSKVIKDITTEYLDFFNKKKKKKEKKDVNDIKNS